MSAEIQDIIEYLNRSKDFGRHPNCDVRTVTAKILERIKELTEGECPSRPGGKHCNCFHIQGQCCTCKAKKPEASIAEFYFG